MLGKRIALGSFKLSGRYSTGKLNNACINSVAFNPSGTTVLAINKRGVGVEFDPATFFTRHSFVTDLQYGVCPYHKVAYNPDPNTHQYAVTAFSSYGNIARFEWQPLANSPEALTEVGTPTPFFTCNIVYSPTGTSIFVSLDKNILGIDIVEMDELPIRNARSVIRSLDASDRTLLAGDENGGVTLFLHNEADAVTTFKSGINCINAVKFSPFNANHCLIGGFSQFATLWDIETKQEIQRFNTDWTTISALTTMSSGLGVVAGESVKIFDIRSNGLVQDLKTKKYVTSVAATDHYVAAGLEKGVKVFSTHRF